ncbi:hypothetical protein [Bordetella sp. N]|uniref:hypothetical protein n=1 Tax=Bordetella sp. N TaxID=1746199 RepID=UPI0007108DC5|nr:hypothetical protein [Bordetella sp. N]ALM85973.1 hypothetical protein ASB57_26195 [Bordetella sp. N]
MSGDGSVVVGGATNSATNTQSPFTYTSAGGISFLSADPATSTVATDINGNGTLAVGTAVGYTGPGGPVPTQGVIWDLTTGTRVTVVTPGATSATLLAISADGKVVGGSATFSDSTGIGNAIVQNLGSSVVTRLDPTNSYTGGSSLTKLNSDGTVGVGFGFPVDSSTGINGFRWTAAGGMTDLGHLNGGAYLVPTSLNASGDVVVGTALDGASGKTRSFRWTAPTGIVSLGVLHGDINTNSIAYGVDASGNVVVGYSQSATSPSSSDGYRWTAATGMQTIPEWLNSKGIAVAGSAVAIATAQAVSADGNTVSGTLSDGNVYIARVVETTTAPVTPVDPTSPTSPSAPSAPETPPATGAGSGIITLSNFMSSLSAAAQGPSQSLQATNMVLTGAHGSRCAA